MKELFSIQTDELEIIWSGPNSIQSGPQEGVVGLLRVTAANGAANLETTRHTFNLTEITDENVEVGPALYEQINYGISVRSKLGKPINLTHSDPNVGKFFSLHDQRKSLHGTVNFRSDVGYSTFTATVAGVPEVEFTVEVFPTKIDYKTDYAAMIAETQEIVYGLVYDYLKSTYQRSRIVARKKAGSIEWFELLKFVVNDLEQGLAFIQKNPSRALTPQYALSRVDKVRKTDSKVRRSLVKCSASFSNGKLRVHPFKVEAQTRTTTLLTPEHRWLAAQLGRIKAKLLLLRKGELSRGKTERRDVAIRDLSQLIDRITRSQQAELFRECKEAPPAGFASLLLLSGPGYRECYQACRLLNFGLSIVGGPINMALKDLNSLYEYWCFLSVAELIAEYSGEPVQADKLLKPCNNGLELQLKKGVESKIVFGKDPDRQIELIYNKKIIDALVPQQPDITISLKERGWPSLNVLLDAKYRVKSDTEYTDRYNKPGPPEDAINVLHRYRDAILFKEAGQRPKHSIIQAAALFPYSEAMFGEYYQSGLWQSLEQIGIGAIPLLPSNKMYLKEWLTTLFRSGAWSVAEQALGHTAAVQVEKFRTGSLQGVLVGALRSSGTSEHLDWIQQNHLYYMPLLKANRRQFAVKYVAIYSPDSLIKGGAVSHYAEVLSTSVVPRDEIITPWSSARKPQAPQIVYSLGELLPLPKLIKNREIDKKGQRFSAARWSTKLALDRARNLSELLLESEQEWRLYEQLVNSGFDVSISAGAVGDLDEQSTAGRAIFTVNNDVQVRWVPFEGFVWSSRDSKGVASNLEKMMIVFSDY